MTPIHINKQLVTRLIAIIIWFVWNDTFGAFALTLFLGPLPASSSVWDALEMSIWRPI